MLRFRAEQNVGRHGLGSIEIEVANSATDRARFNDALTALSDLLCV